MVILDDMKKCYGCTACFNVCATGAITMRPNDEGFIEPVIDDGRCVECGKCQSVCPALHPDFSNSESPKVLAFVSDPKTMKVSSSGGVFTVLAQEILARGGAVAGAAYDDDLLVRHIVIDDLEDIDKLRRSKYVQSDQGSCYAQVKAILQSGRPVLYTGCPCQIAGLKGYLGKSYEGLFTVDLLCMGAPSPKLYKEYLDSFFGNNPVAKVEMRSPKRWSTCFKVTRENGSSEIRIGNNDIFIRAFTSGLIERPTCYGCAFARLPRQGDITMGDFWGAKRHKAGDPFEKRSSIVLLNSKDGEDLWKSALKRFDGEHSILDLTKEPGPNKLNRNIHTPVAFDIKKRELFFKHYETMPFARAVLATLYGYDVGMVLFASNNYGSTATNVALYTALKKLGRSPVVLDSLVPPTPNGIAAKYFEEHLPRTKGVFEDGDYRTVNMLCDTFIVGSDQSWRVDFDIMKKYAEYMLLGFVENRNRRISYASSFGPKRDAMDESWRKLYGLLLSRIDALSVREDYAVEMCSRLFGVEARQIIDPVFIVDREDYESIAREAQFEKDGDYVFAYILDPSPEKRQLLYEVAAQLKMDLVVVCDAGFYQVKRRELDMKEVIDKPSFENWLALFSNASFVVTDSFHGCCFSLIFEKEFIGVKSRTLARFDSLEKMVYSGYEAPSSLFFDTAADALASDWRGRSIEWNVVRKNLESNRTIGLEWLEAALAAPVQHAGGDDGPDADLLVDYARGVRNRESVTYESKTEFIQEKRSSWLNGERVRRKNRQAAIPFTSTKHDPQTARSLAACEDLREYFSLLGDGKGYVVVLAGKEECSVYWNKFVEATGLPLSLKPRFRQSYVAVVKDGKATFEKSGSGFINKSASFRSFGRRSLNKKNWPLLSKLPIRRKHFAQMHVLACSGGFKTAAPTASVMVNNLEYAQDQRGVNVVVIDLEIASVIDSFYVDVHDDPKLRIMRAK